MRALTTMPNGQVRDMLDQVAYFPDYRSNAKNQMIVVEPRPAIDETVSLQPQHSMDGMRWWNLGSRLTSADKFGMDMHLPYFRVIYGAPAVHLDGTFWAMIAPLVTADSPHYSFSGWVKQATATGSDYSFFYDIEPPGGESAPFAYPDGRWGFESFNPETGDGISVDAPAGTFVYNTVWKHLFGWLDNSTGQRTGKLYLDGVDVTGTIIPTGGPQNFIFHGKEFDLSDNATASGEALVAMDLADWWIAPGVLEKDVTKFRDPVTGRPRHPATFPQAAILLSGDQDHFLLNALGSEGALIVQAGSLTNAATSPSD